jgi:hypothetical protein
MRIIYTPARKLAELERRRRLVDQEYDDLMEYIRLSSEHKLPPGKSLPMIEFQRNYLKSIGTNIGHQCTWVKAPHVRLEVMTAYATADSSLSVGVRPLALVGEYPMRYINYMELIFCETK